MTFPKNRSNRNIKENLRRDFFQIAAHFVFAIIVAQSFLIATELLIPLNMIFENDDKFLRTASLFLAYVVIISGWVGYARSMSEKPHKDDIKGAFRFLLDLIILFEYFYLLQLTITTKYFQDEFHWVLVSIFSTYLIWDIVKYFEYRSKKERKTTRSRGGWTLVFFIICLAVSLCYHFLVVEGISELEIFKDKQAQTLNFIVLMLAVNLGYRIFKWNTRNKKTSFT